jgi:hypothetical protein
MQKCGEIFVRNAVFDRDKYCHGVLDSIAYTLYN